MSMHHFHARVDPVRFQEKARWDTLCSTCVFASCGICGFHSAFRYIRARNVDALFFMLGWAQCSFHEKRVGTRYVELVFLHPVGSVGPIVHSGETGARNVDTLFFMVGLARCGFHNQCARNMLLRTCVFASGRICASHSAFQCIRGVKC
jgi:hypothetical protein